MACSSQGSQHHSYHQNWSEQLHPVHWTTGVPLAVEPLFASSRPRPSLHHLGEHAEAVEYYRESASLYRTMGDRYYEAGTLVRKGETHRAAGDDDSARATWLEALSVLEMLDHPDAGGVRVLLQSIPQ